MRVEQQMVNAGGGAELCVETTGDPGAPPILLIAGASSSMDYWDEELCRRLAGRGRRVVRYDHRDTGRSTSYPAGAPGYTGADLTTDALAVLDGLGLDRAHLVGLSMGGGIA
ncbi:MAG TPA: alpha/beta fold hydrolase, partial [Solirubrobacteraceae bacterium]|nr:alpha/beta fold hydrolase [Solirubrobacteraceae bacterium]